MREKGKYNKPIFKNDLMCGAAMKTQYKIQKVILILNLKE